MYTKETDRQAHYKRLGTILADIYGKKLADSHTSRFADLIEATAIPQKTHTASERDAILIAYGDHLSRIGEKPLITLDIFSKQYFQGLINGIHILPHYPSTSDDGFAVSDYLSVDPELGEWSDIERLGRDFHVMLDAVFNHTSASHEWFKRFLEDDPKYKNYFIALDADTDVSQVTRPRTHPLLTSFETPTGIKHVWTTFSTDQIDLNFADPDVLYDIIQTLLMYVQHGADLIRFDAVAFVWKELGTNCIHHPKVHALVQFMREVLRLVAPWVWLVTETNVPHQENVSYFGNGHDQAHMVYNFALPPLIVHSLQTGNAEALTTWAKTLKTPSDQTHFFNFTASHDGIGVRAVTGMLSDLEIAAMCDRVKQRGGYLSMKTNPDGTESVYEMNINYFDAVADPEANTSLQVDQFICSQAMMLSLKGVPGVYMHSLLGSRNWQEGVRETGRYRSINREKLDMQTVERELEDPSSIRFQVFDRYAELLRLRADETAFSPLAIQTIIDHGPSVFAIKLQSVDGDSTVLALHNITGIPQAINLDQDYRDLVSNKRHHATITLMPYQVAWLKGEKG